MAPLPAAVTSGMSFTNTEGAVDLAMSMASANAVTPLQVAATKGFFAWNGLALTAVMAFWKAP